MDSRFRGNGGKRRRLYLYPSDCNLASDHVGHQAHSPAMATRNKVTLRRINATQRGIAATKNNACGDV